MYVDKIQVKRGEAEFYLVFWDIHFLRYNEIASYNCIVQLLCYLINWYLLGKTFMLEQIATTKSFVADVFKNLSRFLLKIQNIRWWVLDKTTGAWLPEKLYNG